MDSSSVIAYLNGEPGGDTVRMHLADAVMCSVNIAEVMGWLVRRGEAAAAARSSIERLQFEVADFDFALSIETGALIAKTSGVGLSLGDWACLAVAAREGIPAMTADRAWANLDIGVTIQLIR
jgi:ribonuclease VapC